MYLKYGMTTPQSTYVPQKEILSVTEKALEMYSNGEWGIEYSVSGQYCIWYDFLELDYRYDFWYNIL